MDRVVPGENRPKMLLTTEPTAHPSLMQLSTGARSAWFAAIQRCDLFHSDVLAFDELDGADDQVIDEWEHAVLAARLPAGNLRMLEHLSLWALDHTRPRAA